MDDIQRLLDIAERECKAHGAKLTRKRTQVLSGLLLKRRAMSAYELIEFCSDEFGEVMPAITMYRVLDFLSEKGLVHKLSIVNKFVACAHIGCEHNHVAPQFLICSKCHKVAEMNVAPEQLDELKKSVERAGFHLEQPQLEMNCICKTCFEQC